MKIIIVLLLSSLTLSCVHRGRVCIEGVLYYTYDRGIAPAYQRNGKLFLCNEESKTVAIPE